MTTRIEGGQPNPETKPRLRLNAFVGAGLFLLSTVCMLAAPPAAQPHSGIGHAHGAQNTGSLQGTVSDAKGGLIAKATVTVRDASGHSKTVTTDGEGHFAVNGLAPGSYSVVAVAPGFSAVIKNGVGVSDSGAQLAFTLPIGGATTDITVDADQTHSIAAALAPMDALLDATSARTEITSSFIRNFTSPIADYGEIVKYVPGTFTVSQDGVGLGQSKTYFRGFPDGDYDIDYDGVPFYDTNTPTHHSWAFFPAQSIGGVDFDRSPGTASTIGPAPFGGSIHLLSPSLSPVDNLRVTFSGGSYNTYLYDAQYDSGSFGPGHKFDFTTDVHHMQSHGWQSLNNQNQNAGDIKMEYRVSDKLDITGYSGVIWVDANTPNFSATRCQMYGVSATNAYSCTLAGTPTGLYPYTGAGINFLLTNNSDPELYLDTQYNYYHVPTDFEYVDVNKQFGKGWTLDFKPYTYNYDNSEKYANAVPITDNAALLGTVYAPLGTKIATLCDQYAPLKKGVVAEPCGVDKYNSYRKYGEIGQISNVTKYGILRAGFWYEWANTNRHQYPSDPLNHWMDQPLPNFAEKFVTDSYQPYVEYQWHLTSKLNITPGVKFAYYTIGTQQFADDGKTIGCLVTTVSTVGCNPSVNTNINPNAFIANGGSYFAALPSGSINYRIKNNWSVYFQGATGSVVPPSSVFDYQQGVNGQTIPPAVFPQQQKNTTYQGGTVLKLKRVTLDVDYYHIYFDNSYSSTLNSEGEPVYYLQPASITQGFEAESNISLTHGLGVYLNGSYDSATYTGSLAATCTSTAALCATAGTLNVTVPSGLHVQQSPSDIETQGVTYQHGAWDASFFNQRIGQQYIDNGAYHNQYVVNPFDEANAFVNYTLRTGGRFDQTKIRLTFNNIFNSSAVNGITLANSPVAPTITSNGAVYTNPFNATTAISGQDNVAVNAGRSIMLSVTFGLSPHHQ